MPYENEEAMSTIVEDKDVDAAIQDVLLRTFSNSLEEREQLRSVLWEKRHVFKGMGTVRDEFHKIAMKLDAKPIVRPGRRLSPKEVEAERVMAKKMLAVGVLDSV